MVGEDKPCAEPCALSSMQDVEQRALEDIGESLFISRVELTLVSRKLEWLLNTTATNLADHSRRQNWAKQQRIIVQLLQSIEPLETDFRLAAK